MPTGEILEKARVEGWSDEDVVDRVRAGETALYEILVRRYNQRLYRVARAILRDDGEAEDVMQDAYVKAFENLSQYAGRAPFGAWLTKIAVNAALARLRFRGKMVQLVDETADQESSVPVNLLIEESPDPEQQCSKAELGRFLEDAMLTLPEQYRTVLMLREVEEMSTAETAAALNLTEENVKVRLHRGRAMMRRGLFERVGSAAKEAFPFMGARCDRVTVSVMKRLLSQN